MVDGVVLVDQDDVPRLGEFVPFVEVGGRGQLVAAPVFLDGLLEGGGLFGHDGGMFFLGLGDQLVDWMGRRCGRGYFLLELRRRCVDWRSPRRRAFEDVEACAEDGDQGEQRSILSAS